MVAIKVLTIYLFVFELVDIDVSAISIMVLLGLNSLLAPVMGLEHGLVDTKHLFDRLSSNAAMSIIAVMIIGAGLDKTGLMSKVSSYILNIGVSSEGRIIPIISGTVAIISSFMKNVGAGALFFLTYSFKNLIQSKIADVAFVNANEFLCNSWCYGYYGWCFTVDFAQ